MKVLCRSFCASPFGKSGLAATNVVEQNADGSDVLRKLEEGNCFRQFHLFLETILPEDVYCVHFNTPYDGISVYYRVRE